MKSLAALSAAVLAVAPAVVGSALPDCVNGNLKTNKVCDTKSSPRDRAAALVAAMTQSEKLANLVR